MLTFIDKNEVYSERKFDEVSNKFLTHFISHKDRKWLFIIIIITENFLDYYVNKLLHCFINYFTIDSLGSSPRTEWT